MYKKANLNYYSEEYLTMFYNILYKMIRDMTKVKLNNSVSHNFIVQMLPYHKAALEMSHNILQYTSIMQLRRLSLNIIAHHTKSIESMKAMLNTCTKHINNKQQLREYKTNSDEIMRDMFSLMETSEASDRLNCDFISAIIPHYTGGIKMYENVLEFDICTELISAVGDMLDFQKNMLSQMKNLSRRMRCS